MERDFKGIWIPKEIWLEKDLSWVEKILLVEIISLDNEDGCWASNAYFANFFDLSKNRISVLINSLKEKGYITVEMQYKKNTKQIEKRIIRDRYTYMRKQIGGICENSDTPICENSEDNNTSFNNTSLIKDIEKKNNVHPGAEPCIESEKSAEKGKHFEVFEQAWKIYPEKRGKSKVSLKAKKEIEKLGLEQITKIIRRYQQYVENKHRGGFNLNYQNGSTFFNSGYKDFIESPETQIKKEDPRDRAARELKEWESGK